MPFGMSYNAPPYGQRRHSHRWEVLHAFMVIVCTFIMFIIILDFVLVRSEYFIPTKCLIKNITELERQETEQPGNMTSPPIGGLEADKQSDKSISQYVFYIGNKINYTVAGCEKYKNTIVRKDERLNRYVVLSIE